MPTEMRTFITEQREKSWKPVLRGKTFCSPACGFKCTKAEHDLLMNIGFRIVSELGKGWTIRLFEGAGWHLEVISACQRLRVSPRFKGIRINAYYAAIHEAGNDGIRYSAEGTSPKNAIANVKDVAREDLRKIGADLVDLE